MKSFKQWLMALLAVSMLLGVTTACTNGDTEEDTEQTDDTEENTEDTE